MKLSKKPFYSDIGVIGLVYHDWDDHWMTPHHVLTRLSKYFNVLWMNPPKHWREIFSHNNSIMSKIDNQKINDSFKIYDPERWLPEVYNPAWLRQNLFKRRLKNAKRMLEKSGCKRIILYIWHPDFSEALNLIPHELSCYHIDDEYSFSENETNTSEREYNLIKSVDIVFPISPGLMEKKGKINTNTHFSPEGVDYNKYSANLPEPEDLKKIPFPRIGYTGVIKKQLDLDLLLNLAKSNSNWSFIYVGPLAPHKEINFNVERMKQQSNIYFLGQKSVHELIAYPQHFSVCIMPYVVNDYTKYIYPLKLHEYLASGRPIVASPIKSLLEFGGVIKLATGFDEWNLALYESLSDINLKEERVLERKSCAKKYDWENLIFNNTVKKIAQRLNLKLP